MAGAARRLTSLAALPAEEFASLLESITTVVFDCDGVLWTGKSCIPGAPSTIDTLHRLGKRVIFLSNNSTQSRRQYVAKFAKLGFSVSSDEIVSSSFAAAELLRARELQSKHVYVIGEEGLVEELELAGFRCHGLADGDAHMDPAHFTVDAVMGEGWTGRPGGEGAAGAVMGAVVVGMDRRMNYLKLARASCHARYSPGCVVVATNTDSTFPVGDGRLLPGAGTCVGALTTTLGRAPDAIAGKPSASLLRLLQEQLGVQPDRALMVGDRLNTDIEFGLQGGMRTLLVETGVHSVADAGALAEEHQPHFVASSIAVLGQRAAEACPDA